MLCLSDKSSPASAGHQPTRRGGLLRSKVGPFSGPPHESVQVVDGRRERRVRQTRLSSPLDEERQPGKEERYEQHPTEAEAPRRRRLTWPPAAAEHRIDDEQHDQNDQGP